MDYSLQNLNKIAKLDGLTFENFVEKLNLIGLEVDEISNEKLSTNIFLDDTRIFLKIPANREDLLNEKFFLNEISTIFLFEIIESWEKVKPHYFSTLKQHYLKYENYSIVPILSEVKSLVTYAIEINIPRIQASPLWLSNKLLNFGLKSSNIFEDILQLAFHEWGQNINLFQNSNHCIENFKIECLVSSTCYTDLEKSSIELLPGTVVLKNKKDNSILSVLGLLSSNSVQKNKLIENNSFFLEATFYDIHLNPLLLSTLNTKISLKYLRRACLENFKFAFQRILTLLEILTSSTIIPRVYSTTEENFLFKNTKILTLKKKNLENFLNIQIADPLIFQKAGLKVIGETPKEYYFKLPIYRQDLAREIDIIEEYSRFIGYKNFSERLPHKSIIYNKNLFRQKHFIKTFFLNLGFNETLTNPISDSENKNEFSVLINNPLNSESSVLRRSLIPKLLNVFEINSRSSYPRTNFFEIGRTFKCFSNKILEQDKLAGIFQFSTTKTNKKSIEDWFISKGFIENFLLNFGFKNISAVKVKKTISYFHPTRSVVFLDGKKVLGIFGELNPSVTKEKYSHVRGSIYLFELNLHFFKEWQLSSQVELFSEYSKYPLIIKDVSIPFNKEVNFYLLKSFLFSQSNYLKKVRFFDIYFEEKEFEIAKIGIRLEFQSKTETLTNEFIEQEVEKLKIVISNKFLVANPS